MAFRAFRTVTSLVLGVIAAVLLVYGVLGVFDAAGSTTALDGVRRGEYQLPISQLIGALLLVVLVWFALWGENRMRRVLENIFSIPELVRKLAFTAGLLAIYRIGFHVPLPGLDQARIAERMQQLADSPFGEALVYLSMFSGGNLQQSTLFGLGIMPYITASIILQLLTSVVPSLERLQREGQAGYRKIQEYTRYLTVLLCVVQSAFWMRYMGSSGLLYPEWQGSWMIYVVGMLGLTTGTVFLMWLGEQIDEYGIGNGISLLIMAGIVSRLPGAIYTLVGRADLSLATPGGGEAIGPLSILFLIAAFVFVVAGAILITQGQRRIPIQQAKHTRGRRVYGGQRHYMPLRVNHGGVMPIIFASSLMLFPGAVFGYLGRAWPGSSALRMLTDAFRNGSYVWTVCYIALIFFFAFFWTTVQFRPREMADQLRDYGHFIPGLRPGRRTAEYLERVMERITYVGAAFLAAIAVIPTVINAALGIPPNISAFLGGTGLLITVSVTLDLVQRIEANLVMRNYGGFLGGSTRIKGAYR